ncbi:MAG: hypothetical protein LBE62_14615 [Azonexus sp.]|jgi:hypothetical protein|nr:hypothetical protein [Azonexus sp.]
MTTTRLTSTTERYAITPAYVPPGDVAYRIEAAESLGGDRKRSLREELEAAASAIGSSDSDNASEIQEEARRVAVLIAGLTPADGARLLLPGNCSLINEAA